MKSYLLNQSKKNKYIIAFGDIFIITAAVLVSYSIRIYINQGEFTLPLLLNKLNFWHLMIIPLHLFTFYIFDLFSLDRMVGPARYVSKIVISILFAGLLMSGVFFFVPKYVFGRQVLLIPMLVLSLFIIVWRVYFFRAVHGIDVKKKIALICSPEKSSFVIENLSNRLFKEIEVSHVCSKECKEENKSDGIKYCSSVSELLDDNSFDIIVFDSAEDFSNEEIRLILETRQKNKAVYDISNLYISFTGKVPLEFIDGRWLISSQGMQGVVSKPYLRVKRFMDVFFACGLIVFLSPFILIAGALIKVESRGRVIFAQERLGMNRKPFMCYKFRTMVENAEQATGPVWSSDDDPRITSFGRILRKSRLDELPQLWNIVKGDISFVGPRPIRKHFADLLSRQIPFYELRFSVQPGLSGWAQVNHDYAGSEDGQLEKFKYELFYIQNMSLFLDIIVVFKTVQSFFKVEGK